MDESPNTPPHPASAARFARKRPVGAYWGYAVFYVVAFAVLGVALAVTDRGSAERWGGWVVFAVLLGVALVLNARSLRMRRDR